MRFVEEEDLGGGGEGGGGGELAEEGGDNFKHFLKTFSTKKQNKGTK